VRVIPFRYFESTELLEFRSTAAALMFVNENWFYVSEVIAQSQLFLIVGL